MKSNIDHLRKELTDLINEGDRLRLSLALELKIVGDDLKPKLVAMNLPRFKDSYESWYTVALQVVRQVIPDRLADFTKQYKDEKRKQTDFLTYGISDFMIGLQTTRGGEVLVTGKLHIQKLSSK